MNVHYNSNVMYQSVYNDLNVGERTLLWIGSVLLILIGIGLTFYGRKLFQKLMALAAFLIGFMIPLFIRASFSANSNLYDVNWKIYAPVCIIVGFMLFMLVWCIFMAAIVVIAAISGAILGKMLFTFLLMIDPNMFHSNSNLQYYNVAFIIGGVIIVFILMYYLYKALLVLLTPLIGSIFVISSLMYIIEQITKKYTYGAYNHWWNYQKELDVYKNIHNKWDKYLFWTMIGFYLGFVLLFLMGFFYQSKIHPYELVVQNDKKRPSSSSTKSYDEINV